MTPQVLGSAMWGFTRADRFLDWQFVRARRRPLLAGRAGFNRGLIY